MEGSGATESGGAGEARGTACPAEPHATPSYHPRSHAASDLAAIASGTPDRCKAGAVLSDRLVAMRDGVRLATDVYLPDAPGPFPTILVRLPYGKTEPHCAMPLIGNHWSRKGYAAVVQDVRGKWGSEGAFQPADGAVETRDGTDTIAWITRQAFSNGRVGMWGESYYGFTSYAGAVGGHEALACIAPGDISVDRFRNAYRWGAFQMNTIGNWALSMVVGTAQDVTRCDPWHLPVAEIPETGGIESPYFQEVVANARRGPFWSSRSLLEAYEKVDVPVLLWSGWWDNFLGPALTDWQILSARPELRGRLHLFIGPWDHEGSSEATDRVGAMLVGRHGARRWDTFQAFFDRYLMGLDNGFDRQPPVEIFTTGRSQWGREQEWPPRRAVPTPLYLSSGGRANTLRGDGTLAAAPPPRQPPDRYAYDPADPVADTLATNCWAAASESRDRSPVEARPDVLCYTGEPLTADLRITGPVSALLHAASSAVDTDFWVGLVDVDEAGYATLIQDGILRTSARNGEDETAPPLEPGRIYPLAIDLWAASHVFLKGHRIRVEVTSSCFDKFARNTNSGEPFATARRIVVAEQAIHHDREHPSHVLLPVVPA